MDPLNLIALGLLLLTGTTCGVLTNVAFHKPTKFIDEPPEPPSRIVDGDPSYMWGDNSCIRSNNFTNNWWLVDLLFAYDIYNIRISNRRYLNENLANFSIYISMENPLPIREDRLQGQLCLTVPDYLRKGLTSLHCNETIRGRFVYLWKPANDRLSFCEFEVFVEEEEERSMKRDVQFSLIGDHADIEYPLYSYKHTVVFPRPSPMKCVTDCLEDESDWILSHIQINTKTGDCHCIQSSPLLEDPQNLHLVDEDDLYQITLDH